MATINYAEDYQRELAQQYPDVLSFGALYDTPNNLLWTPILVDGIPQKTINIPRLTVTGRTNVDRDTVGTYQRNVDNDWEVKVLEFERKWDTLLHPMDDYQTNMTVTIANATRVMNEEEKFPEMDRYCISKIHSDWIGFSGTEDNTVLTEANVLTQFDSYMAAADEARVPMAGRILYVTPATYTLLKNAENITRYLNLNINDGNIQRAYRSLDDVTIISVPSDKMLTLYDFTIGSIPGIGAKQINMVLIHPTAVYTPVSYSFAGTDEPSAKTGGKILYYEESFMDTFVIERRNNAIYMNVSL